MPLPRSPDRQHATRSMVRHIFRDHTLSPTSIGNIFRKSTFNRGRTNALTNRSSSVSLMFSISARNRCRSAVPSLIKCRRTLRKNSSSSTCAACQLGNTSGASSRGMGDGAGVGGEAGKFKALLSDRVRGASTRMIPSSSWTSVLSVWLVERILKGGESGATGPTMEDEEVG